MLKKAAFILVALIGTAANAQIKCNGAKTLTEKTVCADGGLQLLDRRLSKAYQNIMRSDVVDTTSEVRKTQRSWLKARDACESNISCIANKYEQRLREINDLARRAETSIAKFLLVNGNRPVCQAYLKYLNAADFTIRVGPDRSTLELPPHCDRPTPSGNGFGPQQRRILSEEEIVALKQQFQDFLVTQNPFYSQSQIEGERRFKNNSSASQQSPKPAHLSRTPYEIVPGIDIDNDGSKDRVVIWPSENACGTGSIAGVGAMVLKAKNFELDASKTTHVFGHPTNLVGGDGLAVSMLYDSVSKKHVPSPEKSMRQVGAWIGVFEYRGVAYIDTFLDQAGDVQGRRAGDRTLASRLAVLAHQKGKSAQVCEYKWTDPAGLTEF
jgi:uncharacterized protein YecT (DUF1311 family)